MATISYSSGGIFNGMSITLGPMTAFTVTSTGTWTSDSACPCPMCRPDNKYTVDQYFQRFDILSFF